MPEQTTVGAPALRVIDAFDHPHGGRILRVRVDRGTPPPLRSLRGARLGASGPEGAEGSVRVLGFPVTGGKPSDRRVQESGRFDLHVEVDPGAPPVSRGWKLHPGDG